MAARRPWLDVLKGVAMALVVVNHAILWPMRTGDGTSAFLYGTAYGTVAAFAAVTGYIGGMRPPSSHLGRTIRHRAFQLLLPWAFWAVLYAAAPFVWQGLGGVAALPTGFKPWPWALALALGGGPLWFLPVIFVAAAVGVVMDRRTRSWWPAIVPVALYVVVAALAWRAGRSPLALGEGTFWAVSPLYVASYWVGLRFARDGVPAWVRRIAWPTVVLTAVAAGVITYVRVDLRDATLMWLPYLVAMPGGWAALALAATATAPVPTDDALRSVALRWLARAGVASRAVYVLHPVVVAPVMLALTGAGVRGLGLVVGGVLSAILGVAVSTRIAEWARTTRHGHAIV